MGETFGRYTVVRQLGRGAMGVVYLATDPMLNRQVAVKTVDLGVEEPSEREFLRERLLRDARAAAVLKHPNIVAIYDVFEENNRAYVVMEFIEGDSLAARLKASPLPDASLLLTVLRQAAEALDYTHSRGVIHRDIKPANIMIDSNGVTKIMDFGIARITDARTCTPTGMVMGTVEYMAPEQILGESVDGRADQFALAVVAYQMLTGGTLFGPHNVATLTYKIVNEAPPPPSTRNTALPRGVDAVLVKALSKKPDARFASCTEFVGALSQALADAPTAPVSAPTAPIPAAGRTGETTTVVPAPVAVAEETAHSRAPLIAAALAVVLLGGGLAAVIWKPWNRPAAPAAVAETSAGASSPAVNPSPAPKTAARKDVPAPTNPEPEKPIEPPAPTAKTEPAKSAPKAVEPAKVEAANPQPVETEEVELPAAAVEPKGGGATPFAQALHQGQDLVNQNNYQAAMPFFEKAVSLRPQSAEAYYMRGIAYQHTNRTDLAMQDFAQALRLNPKLGQAHTTTAQCLVRLKRDPEALVEFQRAIELKPDAVAAFNGRGAIYMRRNQFRLALADFDTALSINPRYQPALQNRVKAREAVGDVPGAAADRRILQSLHRQ